MTWSGYSPMRAIQTLNSIFTQMMFYIVFLLSNFLALGVGVWVAIRHGEILHSEEAEKSDETSGPALGEKPSLSNDETETDKPSTDEPFSADAPLGDSFIEKQTQNEFFTSPDVAETDFSVTDNISEADTPQASVSETAAIPDENDQPFSASEGETILKNKVSPQEMLALKSTISEKPAKQESTETPFSPQTIFSSDEVIEQLAVMVADEESSELKAIVSQLQQISEMATTADRSCYASVDAEAFVMAHEEKYTTTAICRPMVGRKK